MWPLIITLIVIGLALVILEVVFVPGMTVVGIIGVIFAGAGIILCYRHFGSETGLYVLLGTSAVSAVALYFSFRSNAWMRFANKSAIKSRVNESIAPTLTVGQEGMTVSTLKPYGRAQFGDEVFEVKTPGDYVDVGTKVSIIHIQGNQIIVKPLN